MAPRLTLQRWLRQLADGQRARASDALSLLPAATAAELQGVSEQLALAGHGPILTWSPKVFIPLTQLCRDVCHYCTFAKAPRELAAPYMPLEAVLALAQQGAALGCAEALFTLGDKPEQRYRVAAEFLAAAGHSSTIDYVIEAAALVLRETPLLPHVNAGVLSGEELGRVRTVAASFGLMLESSSERLCEPGQAHYGSPDKAPVRRLATLAAAGELQLPTTSGILLGIGETRLERIEALLALRDLHDRYGHLQDLIVQNFRAKPGTRMATAAEPSLDEQLWTIAAARLLFGPAMSVQTPPNLRPGALEALARSGINDWGGVSPLTRDHVNPEAPWPERDALRRSTAATGRELVARLPITPAFARDPQRWCDPALQTRVRHFSDGSGFARADAWRAGGTGPVPAAALATLGGRRPASRGPRPVPRSLGLALAGAALDASDLVALLTARGADAEDVVAAADALRERSVGTRASYVINRNINYTNICTYACSFCAFAKRGSVRAPGQDAPYLLAPDAIALRALEAQARGATEVCLQGGIHPSFTGNTYLDIVRAVKEAVPEMHIHAFSPLEISHGAQTLGWSLARYLAHLRDVGLASLPGTAAEILDDDLRATLCPDKLSASAWLEVMRTAHQVGLRSTATMMFGHIDEPRHWADHLLQVRHLQEQTGGFTEFVPLPFVHHDAPLWRRGLARSGPTFREVLLVHAVARLALHPLIPHIQASWAKLGLVGLEACLRAGADDMGGVLMNESITRAAGGCHGQGVDVAALHALADRLGRTAWQRSTLYQPLRPPGPSSRASEQAGSIASTECLPLSPTLGVAAPARVIAHTLEELP